MPVCAILNCKNRSRCVFRKEGIKFFYFPQDADLQQKWFEACRRKPGDIKLDTGNFLCWYMIQYTMDIEFLL